MVIEKLNGLQKFFIDFYSFLTTVKLFPIVPVYSYKLKQFIDPEVDPNKPLLSNLKDAEFFQAIQSVSIQTIKEAPGALKVTVQLLPTEITKYQEDGVVTVLFRDFVSGKNTNVFAESQEIFNMIQKYREDIIKNVQNTDANTWLRFTIELDYMQKIIYNHIFSLFSPLVDFNSYSPQNVTFANLVTKINELIKNNDQLQQSSVYQDVQHLLNAVKDIMHLAIENKPISVEFAPYYKDMQVIEMTATYQNSFSTHLSSNSSVPFRQYIGTSGWQGNFTFVIDTHKNKQQMKQVNRLLELKRISEDIVRTYKDLSILLPLKVEGTCNFFGLENIYLYNFDIKFVEDSNSTFVLNSQFSAIDKVDFLLLSRRDAEIESIVMDKLEEIMKKSTNLLTYINEVVEKRKTNPNIDIFEQLSADELYQKITNEFLKLLAVVNLQTSSSINDAINQSIANQLFYYKWISESVVFTPQIVNALTMSFLTFDYNGTLDDSYVQNIAANMYSRDLSDSILPSLAMSFYILGRNNQLRQIEGNNKDILQQNLELSDLIADKLTHKDLDKYLSGGFDTSSGLEYNKRQEISTYFTSMLLQNQMNYHREIENSVVRKHVSNSKSFSKISAQYISFMLFTRYYSLYGRTIKALYVTESETFAKTQEIFDKYTNIFGFDQFIFGIDNNKEYEIEKISHDELKKQVTLFFAQLQYLIMISNILGLVINFENEQYTNGTFFTWQHTLQNLQYIFLPWKWFGLLVNAFVEESFKDLLNNLDNLMSKISDIKKVLPQGVYEFIQDDIVPTIKQWLEISPDVFNAVMSRIKSEYENDYNQYNKVFQFIVHANKLFEGLLQEFAKDIEGKAFYKTLISYDATYTPFLDNATRFFTYIEKTLVSKFYNIVQSTEYQGELEGNPIIPFDHFYISDISAEQGVARESIETISATNTTYMKSVLNKFKTLLDTKEQQLPLIAGNSSQNNIAKQILGYLSSNNTSTASLYLSDNIQQAYNFFFSTIIGSKPGKQDFELANQLLGYNDINTVPFSQAIEVTNMPVGQKENTSEIHKKSIELAITGSKDIPDSFSLLEDTIRKYFQKKAGDEEANKQIFQTASLFKPDSSSTNEKVEEFYRDIDTLSQLSKQKLYARAFQLSAQYLNAYYLAQFRNKFTMPQLLQPKQAIAFITRGSVSKQRYIYPQVIEAQVTREKDNPVDVQMITIPDLPFFRDAGEIQLYSRQLEYIPVTQLLQPGADIELLIGYSKKIDELSKIFAGYIRQVARNENGTITIIAEGYGSVLVRPVFKKSDTFHQFFTEPRALVVKQFEKVKSEALGYKELSTVESLFRNILDKYSIATTSKIYLAQLTAQPYAENLYFPSEYWASLRSYNKQYWSNFEMHFANYTIKQGSSAWDVIYDQVSMSPDFIQQVEPIDSPGEARLFFGKPTWPFKYRPVYDDNYDVMEYLHDSAKDLPQILIKQLDKVKELFRLQYFTQAVVGKYFKEKKSLVTDKLVKLLGYITFDKAYTTTTAKLLDSYEEISKKLDDIVEQLTIGLFDDIIRIAKTANDALLPNNFLSDIYVLQMVALTDLAPTDLFRTAQAVAHQLNNNPYQPYSIHHNELFKMTPEYKQIHQIIDDVGQLFAAVAKNVDVYTIQKYAIRVHNHIQDIDSLQSKIDPNGQVSSIFEWLKSYQAIPLVRGVHKINKENEQTLKEILQSANQIISPLLSISFVESKHLTAQELINSNIIARNYVHTDIFTTDDAVQLVSNVQSLRDTFDQIVKKHKTMERPIFDGIPRLQDISVLLKQVVQIVANVESHFVQESDNVTNAFNYFDQAYDDLVNELSKDDINVQQLQTYVEAIEYSLKTLRIITTSIPSSLAYIQTYFKYILWLVAYTIYFLLRLEIASQVPYVSFISDEELEYYKELADKQEEYYNNMLEQINALRNKLHNETLGLYNILKNPLTIVAQHKASSVIGANTNSEDQVKMLTEAMDILMNEFTSNRLNEVFRVFNFGKRGLLDALQPKLYPEGTKPFADLYYIHNQLIIKNKLILNNDVANRVVLYSPTWMQSIGFLTWLTKFVESAIPLISSGYEVIDGKHMQVTEQIFDDDIPDEYTNTKTVVTHYGNIPQVRILIATHFLKKSLEEMYDGEIITVGLPGIKPYDYIYIEDTFRQMMGLQRVKSVTHIYSPDYGFVTSIKVMPIIDTRDLHMNSINYVIANLFNYAAGALLIYLGLSGVAFAAKQFPFLKAIPKSWANITSIANLLTHNAQAGNDSDSQTIGFDRVYNPVTLSVLSEYGQPFVAGIKGSYFDKISISQEVKNQQAESMHLFLQKMQGISNLFSASWYIQRHLDKIFKEVGTL